ncbi:hypothetical protein A7A76_05080 [Lysobacter enzymogenes]|uniref:hypothetical protein n=1 Tax=Lysobacter enzymogenes TaxID=69 RepID=UPI0019D06404|nr:hypothetical protein [Lysobacter enzymogenes]MBN7138499.1 hypothetical protein [Lysobacter enzymogenes]
MKIHALSLVAMMSLAATGQTQAQEPGDVCQEAWKQSSASKSCTSFMQKLKDGSCGGRTECQPKNYPTYPAGLSLEKTRQLVNCDGELKYNEADCPSSSKHTTEAIMASYQPTQYATHDPACMAAWEASSAKQTCITLEYITRSSAGLCTIQTQCSYGPGYVVRDAANMVKTGPNSYALGTPPPRKSKMTVSEADAKKLSNCDGYLKIGSCD